MAGLEVVVRPVVFPNIRSAPARSLPPADDPEKGFCVIKGNGAVEVKLTYSFSWSFSKSKQVEHQRQVDEVRVYQKQPDGTIDKDNYVDIQVANKIWSRGGNQPTSDLDKAKGGGGAGAGEGGGGGDDTTGKTMSVREVRWYKRAEETDNMEVRKENIIIKNKQGSTDET